ncbi:hypothetical protein [Salirhabdus salicampi]|uniref:hypothetical protein n=1 Tax=Salirhabdus salicampi TaxID=476102 RepID=UPI0020C2BD43|nr:hypothetical protein [Salirhabdus salicampi]MCP8617992.1 hypothetical protein [Salirhabdus salicampi]
MIGMMINDMEKKELEYLLKREMEEILHDLNNRHIDHVVKRAMRERYQLLFRLFKRVAGSSDCLRYMPSKYFSSGLKNKES